MQIPAPLGVALSSQTFWKSEHLSQEGCGRAGAALLPVGVAGGGAPQGGKLHQDGGFTCRGHFQTLSCPDRETSDGVCAWIRGLPCQPCDGAERETEVQTQTRVDHPASPGRVKSPAFLSKSGSIPFPRCILRWNLLTSRGPPLGADWFQLSPCPDRRGTSTDPEPRAQTRTWAGGCGQSAHIPLRWGRVTQGRLGALSHAARAGRGADEQLPKGQLTDQLSCQ